VQSAQASPPDVENRPARQRWQSFSEPAPYVFVKDPGGQTVQAACGACTVRYWPVEQKVQIPVPRMVYLPAAHCWTPGAGGIVGANVGAALGGGVGGGVTLTLSQEG
jgi:hypothetical protein